MYAKKHLGQHFLTSPKALFDMVTAGDVQDGDVVLEIGPGKGVLTKELLDKGATVLAIEKDAELLPLLKEKFTQAIETKKLFIEQKDILTFTPNDSSLLTKRSYKLIANIPYYITGAIIEQFLGTTHQPERMVLLIQKEVAERIIARDQKSGNLGGKQSILSIAVSVYGTPKIISKVPAGAFFPPPKVDSAIIAITDISKNFFKQTALQKKISEQTFFKLLTFCFGKKRKQLIGSLAEYLGNRAHAARVLAEAAIPEHTRPETLLKEDWRRIVSAL